MTTKCKDELMREAHPALKDLWEQYLIMYELLDDGSITEEESFSEAIEEIQRRQEALLMSKLDIRELLA